ncbi:60s acidic ribosomal protein-domain-containing protein [Gilbertella persicaria]|uniref:60s acidic ribosomal protein-domain-containing protein n=1 Tax=Gilbertella persicaria TaxID=101096 RepID=UPI00221E969D|nr:60s acidic ribosomal protein-domain-containing protein [Gilbertella persicaria]KAI8068164.1 60s acidic ribosomal protein-domain-containing protein [Gilbertella persicaria]
MKYLASYLLLVAGGKTSPSAADVKALMASVGVEAEEERLTSLISALEGKNIEELTAEGLEKMSSVPTGGAVAAAGAASSGAAADAPAAEAAAEEKEESDDDMGFGLFD